MIRIGDIVTVSELSKIYAFIFGKLNMITQDNIANLNTGNILGTDSDRTFEPLDSPTEQFTGYIGGSGSWLSVIKKDANDAINR